MGLVFLVALDYWPPPPQGLVDTAVKTARSGYLQRCLVKHLESLTVAYDYTVRDGDGSVVQFHYGEDSLDVVKSKYLEKFSFFAKNYASLLHKLDPAAAIRALDVESVKNYLEDADLKKVCVFSVWRLVSLFLLDRVITWCIFRGSNPFFRHDPLKLITLLCSFPFLISSAQDDPVLSRFAPTSFLGATSEKFQRAVQAYVAKNPDRLIRDTSTPAAAAATAGSKLTAEKFEALMSLNYLRSVVDPGEAVGCIAGQSVGEPSTQMTLNTFHLAGQGGRNVTLGIPRLREIVMTASAHISTPSMELKLLASSAASGASAEQQQEAADIVCRRLSRLRLSELIDYISAKESIEVDAADAGKKVRAYRLRLHLLPLRDAKFVIAKHAVAFHEVAAAVESSFAPKFCAFIARQLKRANVGAGGAGGADAAANVIQKQRAGRMGDGAAAAAAAAAADDIDIVMDPEEDDEDGGSGRGKSKSKSKKNMRRKSGGAGEGDEEDEDELNDSAEGDGDATEATQRGKKSEGRDYDDADDEDREELRKAGQRSEDEDDDSDDDDDEEDAGSDDDEQADKKKSKSKKSAMVKVAVRRGDSDSDNDGDDKSRRKSSAAASSSASASASKKSSKKSSASSSDANASAARRERLLDAHRLLSDATFDDRGEAFVELVVQVPIQSKKFLLVSAAEATCKLVFVRATRGIEKSFIETRDGGSANGGKELIVTTDGVNFAAAWQLGDRIDVNRIESNDIAAILRTYGVEAARASIMNQVSSVFDAYGIGVDARHLSLISDYMTFQGGFKPLNRMGMEANTSPWLKMTFETCMHFLSSAAEFGDVDKLKSPAARLVVGKPVGAGTGSFDLLYPLAAPASAESQ